MILALSLLFASPAHADEAPDPPSGCKCDTRGGLTVLPIVLGSLLLLGLRRPR